MSSTQPLTLEELIDEFDFLGDWEARCDYLIDLGFELPQLPESDKTEENRVHGCQSQVWMTASTSGTGDEQIIEFVANSDSMLVSGLIAVLMAIYNRKSPADILNTDVEAIFRKLELDRHLSPQRRNGLFGMVQRVRQFAVQVASN